MASIRYCVTALVAVSCASESEIVGPAAVEYPPNAVEGLEPEFASDDWVPDTYPAHDLLMVIDDSGSMADDMLRLMANIDNLVGPMLASGVDARVAVTSTSCTVFGEPVCDPITIVDDGPMMGLELQMAVAGLGIGTGNSTEAGRMAIAEALEQSPVGWGRRVGLDIVVITDEADGTPLSVMSEADMDAILTREAEWRAPFFGFARPSEWVRVSSIVPAPVTDDDPYDICRAMDTSVYEDLAHAWSGIVGDLCTENWSTVVDLVMPAGDTVIYLSRQPVVETIELHVDQIGVDVVMDTSAWTYDEVENTVSILIGRPNSAWVEYQVDR